MLQFSLYAEELAREKKSMSTNVTARDSPFRGVANRFSTHLDISPVTWKTRQKTTRILVRPRRRATDLKRYHLREPAAADDRHRRQFYQSFRKICTSVCPISTRFRDRVSADNHRRSPMTRDHDRSVRRTKLSPRKGDRRRKSSKYRIAYDDVVYIYIYI